MGKENKLQPSQQRLPNRQIAIDANEVFKTGVDDVDPLEGVDPDILEMFYPSDDTEPAIPATGEHSTSGHGQAMRVIIDYKGRNRGSE